MKKFNEVLNDFKSKFKKKEKETELTGNVTKEVTEVKPEIDKSTLGYVDLRNINKVYPNGVQAVFDFNLDIKEHEFIVLVGPSGCGKSTTLRMIAGLEDITNGDLYIDRVRVNNLSPKDRDIALVFQSYALYPHMTVEENIGFGLKMRRVPKDEIKRKVKEAAQILELEDYLDRKPAELSGGQRQRVALGRAIVRNAKVFLMDEPLSNLDAKLRVQMRSEIVKIHKKINATTVYVTHDQTEAMTMADRIVVMRHGYVQQIGTPSEIYNYPSNKFVAQFIGSPSTNVIKALYKDGTLEFDNGEVLVLPSNLVNAHDKYYEEINFDYEDKVKVLENEINKLKTLKKLTEREDKHLKRLERDLNAIHENIDNYNLAKEKKEHYVYFGFRPEDIHHFVDANKKYTKSKEYNFDITLSELLGNDYYLHFKIGNDEIIALTQANNLLIKEGDSLNFHFDLDRVHLFDILSENRII